MTPPAPGIPDEWGREVRGWLLGKLGKSPLTGESPTAEAAFAGRALSWWIFEGKRHRYLDGTDAARRSRWPLLREVVAETFRAAVEPESIDRLPLPSGRDALFELLCAVRILDSLAGPSQQLRILLEAKRGR